MHPLGDVAGHVEQTIGVVGGAGDGDAIEQCVDSVEKSDSGDGVGVQIAAFKKVSVGGFQYITAKAVQGVGPVGACVGQKGGGFEPFVVG